MDNEIKALVFNSYVEYVRKFVEPDLGDRIIQELPVETRLLTTSQQAASAWFPFEHVDRLVRSLVQHAYEGDVERCLELGKWSTMQQFKGVYNAFIRFLNPQFVAGRGGTIWRSYHRKNGELVVKTERNRADASLVGAQRVPAWLVHVTSGGIHSALEASRARDIQVSLISHKDPDAHWDVSWK